MAQAGNPLGEARNIIDRKIASLEESIRVLKSRRNELSPIYRLPTEILCNIFKFSLTDPSSRTRRPESWTNFSQVSRHWRSSALSAPELWTDILPCYHRWTQEMLIRSKMAKLTIGSILLDFATPCPKIVKTVRSCLYEMNRVEEIKFTGISASLLEEIFRGLHKSAPQLHTLCIRSSFGNSFWIHDDLFYDTERLQHVELNSCGISWDSRLLTGLTRLTLEGSLMANNSINQVLDALRRMPALTDLSLHDSIPDDSEGPSTIAAVDLPCLRVLNISSGIGALTAVLRHISFPHSTMLNLTCEENQSTQIGFSNFLSVLTTKFLSTLVIQSLRFGIPDDIETGSDGIEFYSWTNALTQDCFPSSPISQSQLHLVLTWPRSSPDYEKTLTCVFDAMDLSLLTQLQISDSEDVDSQMWVKTFGKLPLLEQVYLEDVEPGLFLDALVYKTKAAEKSKSAYRNISFPKLRYFHLVGADLRPIGNNPSVSVDTLLDYLMERYERNAEVEVLRLENCYITSDEIKRLKEVVVDVIWDEKVINPTDDIYGTWSYT